MANKTVLERIYDVIVDKLSIERDKIFPKAHFVDDLGADSLDMVELSMGFEEEFSIEIVDAVAETITTVEEAVSAIEKLLKEKKGGN